MAYSRGYQPQQQLQQSPSPWASGAPPYLHQQQQIPQHHAVMQPQLQGGYGPPDFAAPGPYGQPGNYSAPMSYGRSPAYVPMSRTGSFGMQQQPQQHRQPVQSGNRNSFGMANKRPGQGFDNSSLMKRNRPANGTHQIANNSNNIRNRANIVPNQSKNLNANNNNRNVQANGTNQQNNSNNNNKNRNQPNKVQNQANKQQNQANKLPNQANKQQNQPNKNQQSQQNKQKANEAQAEIAKHIVPFNGFVCKLCTVYMKDKAARTEHLKDDGHKIRVAEFDADARKTETPAATAATPVATTDAAAAPVIADPVPVVAESAAVVETVENKSPVKTDAAPTTVPVTPNSAAVAAEKTCACNHSSA